MSSPTQQRGGQVAPEPDTTTPDAEPVPSRRRLGKLGRRENRIGWLFAFPGLLVLALLLVGPIFDVLRTSLLTGVHLTQEPEFVGLENYRDIFSDDLFWSSARNTAIFTVLGVSLDILVGLGMALLVSQRSGSRIQSICRSLLVIPWLFTMAVVAGLWVLILGPDGVLNSTLRVTGLMSEPPHLIGDRSTVLWTLIVINVWRGFPFIMVIFLAGLKAIPTDLYAAASVDGASAVQKLRYITLPQLRGTLFVVILLDMIWTIRTFDLVFIMTRGGPMNASHVLATYTYRMGFQNLDYGLASAGAVIILFVSLFVAGGYLWLERRRGTI